MPLADGLQNILIQELISIKPVTEADVDTFFNDIDRVTESYTKAGPSSDLSEKMGQGCYLEKLARKDYHTIGNGNKERKDGRRNA